jgi:hypothetical protein
MRMHVLSGEKCLLVLYKATRMGQGRLRLRGVGKCKNGFEGPWVGVVHLCSMWIVPTVPGSSAGGREEGRPHADTRHRSPLDWKYRARHGQYHASPGHCRLITGVGQPSSAAKSRRKNPAKGNNMGWIPFCLRLIFAVRPLLWLHPLDRPRRQ